VIVVDANILVYAVVESTHSPLARRVAHKDPRWILPPLWRYEVTSSLLKLVRSRALTQEQALAALADAARLVAGREIPVDQARALRAAVAMDLSAYDAQYIALAQAYGIPCVTADASLARKTPGIAVLLSDVDQLRTP